MCICKHGYVYILHFVHHSCAALVLSAGLNSEQGSTVADQGRATHLHLWVTALVDTFRDIVLLFFIPR